MLKHLTIEILDKVQNALLVLASSKKITHTQVKAPLIVSY